MGPRFNGVEDNAIDRIAASGSAASMGPRFNGVEDDERDEDGTYGKCRFNGATL